MKGCFADIWPAVRQLALANWSPVYCEPEPYADEASIIPLKWPVHYWSLAAWDYRPIHTVADVDKAPN